ncbi:MAG: glycosyltransferase family 4 protein [Euryarchaeota archaeon]|nr:glycosyltransferase family 4 protein [Euryarchaeota archaeon]
MRIAFVTFEYPPFIIGGAGVYALNITRELAKLGHQVVVFTPDSSENAPESDLSNLIIQKVSVNKKLPFKALQFWLRLPSEIKKFEKKTPFDILHFNGISYWFLKKRLSKAKHIVTVHHLVKDAIINNNLSFISRMKDISGENSFFMSFLEKKCIKSSDKLVAVSNFTKNQIIDLYNVDPDNIEVIYNGTDLSGYSFTEHEIIKTKKQFGINENPVILFVGRVDDPRKGLDLLLKATKKVLEKMNITLLVVGKGDQTKVREFIDHLGISKNVIFTGFIDEHYLKKCYSLCSIYVCPSKLEGFGLTIIEAMAAEKPIIATNVGAIPEILRGYGYLLNSNDEEKMSEAIVSILSSYKQPIKKSTLYSNVYEFSWKNSSKKLIKFYQLVQENC